MAVDMSNGGDRESELTHALAAVRSRLAAAAQAAGRNAAEIEVLPITKYFPAIDVVTLSRLGCRAVGESRDQEATAKVAEVTRLLAAPERANVGNPRWHMVGHIQRNKARSVAGWAHTAHSVDSMIWGTTDRTDEKAEKLSALLTQPGKTYDVSSPDLPTVK